MVEKALDGKFGTLKGVFIPDVVQMIGVILFLRLGWVLGNAGIFQMSVIITISALLLFITGLSLSAIVSNMKMSGGGAYYLISRALGIEFGSAIGILSCASQLCSISLCVTGFSLSVYEFFPMVSLPLLKAGTLTALVLISYFSTDFALKTQIFIFGTLAVSIGAIFLGSGPPPDSLIASTAPATLSFWAAFAMFFPAMTGIESGMSLSGDLKNPARSLPIGTLAAVGSVYAVYLGISLFLSSFVSPELLRSYPFILYYTSKVGYLIIVGIWAATLSSALGAILGGPRVIQAVAKDGILPKVFSKGFGPTNQPRIATILVLVLGMILTLGTDIDQIIPMLTMSCLISYTLINLIAFLESFIQNPSWRPAVRIHWLISLTGAIGCLIAMFMINPGAAFIVIGLVAAFCVWTAKRKIKGNWDDLKHSIFSFFVHQGTIKLSNLEVSAKSWRPHILSLLDAPGPHKNLCFFSHALNQGKGFLTFGVNAAVSDGSKELYENLKQDLQGFKIPSHLHFNICPEPAIGHDQMIRNYGFGLLRPNTVILSVSERTDMKQLVRLLIDTHSQHKNVILLKDDALKDYLFSDPTRKEKQINLWWRGKYPGNFELCLALAYLLQQSKLWPRAKLCIRMIARDESHKVKLFEQFEKYRTDLRIDQLEFTPLADSEERFFPNFDAYSQGADLSFLGLKYPEGSLEEYEGYLLNLLENTKKVGNIAYVLCGEKIEFRKIFRD